MGRNIRGIGSSGRPIDCIRIATSSRGQTTTCPPERAPGYAQVIYEAVFLKDGPAIFWATGDGSATLQIRVYDPTGKPAPVVPLCERTIFSFVLWQPLTEGVYRIEVRNPDGGPMRCRLKHN